MLFWFSAAGNIFTGIAYLALSIIVFWISRQTSFRFNFILLCFSAFAAVRAIGYYFESHSQWFPTSPWLLSTIDLFVGLCVAAVGIWTYRRRHGIIDVARTDLLAEKRGRELESLAAELEKQVEERTRRIDLMRRDALQFSQQLAIIMDALPTIVALVDRSMTYEIVNAAGAEFFGREKSEVVGKKVVDVVGEVAFKHIEPRLKEAFLGKPVQFSSHLHLKRDRSQQQHVKCLYTPIFDGHGNVTHVVALTTDVTASTAAENYLADARNKAEEASRAKSQFLANMSHEIRTPLAAISGYSELLSNSELAYDEIENAVISIRKNSDQLSTLVNEVLDLSKVESGKLEIERLCFEPSEVLDYVLSIVNITAVEKGVYLKVTVDPSVPKYISTDPVRLRQILINVIGNAVKFTSQGWVSINVKAIPNRIGGSELQFIVKDTGVGINHDRLEKLFEPFSQSDSSPTRKYGGTGLGLALSRKLARALGGDVVLLASKPNSGSEFLITVDGGTHLNQSTPAPHGLFSRTTKLLEAQNSSLEGVKILAVDDSADNRDLIRAFLRPSGAVVEFAENGWDGVETALHGNFDLVLMDIQMPKLDGHQAARKLRNAGYRKPIIAITAHAFKEDRHLAFASGFDDHLTKPIERTSLYNAIGHFVHKGEVTGVKEIGSG